MINKEELIQRFQDLADEKSKVLAHMGHKSIPILFEVTEILKVIEQADDGK